MGGVPEAQPTGTQGAGDELDFEVEMWDDTLFADAPTSTSINPTNPTASPPKSPTIPSAPAFIQAEDQDMWDLVDELQAQAKSSENTVPPGKPPAPVEDDWDDMYA